MPSPDSLLSQLDAVRPQSPLRIAPGGVAAQLDTIRNPVQERSAGETALGYSSQIASGLNESLLGDTLGAPVDVATWLMNLVPDAVNAIGGEGTMGRIEDPFMGSQWINERQRDIGTIGADPTTEGEALARGLSRGVGGGIGAAIPFVG